MKARKRSRGRRAQRGHRRGAFSAQDLFPSGGVAAFFPGVPLGLLGGEMARAGVRASACGLSLKMQRGVFVIVWRLASTLAGARGPIALPVFTGITLKLGLNNVV